MEITLQWFAGFFDGEGYIGITKKSTKKRGQYAMYPRATVSNTYLPALKAIQKQFGGTLHSANTNYYKGSKKCWTLCWSHKKAINLLEKLLPFLVVKKSQAELIISGWKPAKEWKLSNTEIKQRMQLASKLKEEKQVEYLQ